MLTEVTVCMRAYLKEHFVFLLLVSIFRNELCKIETKLKLKAP